MTAEEWKENFRMNLETFLKLCDDLRPSLEGQAARMRINSLAAMLKVRENTPLYSVINWPQALRPVCFGAIR